MKEECIHSYKGYEYRPWEEIEEDNRKTFHDVHVVGDDHIRSLPLSPYSYPSFEYFKMWVDAGCPYPSGQRVSLDELEDIIFEKTILGAKHV
jgi:hypothetical protein